MIISHKYKFIFIKTRKTAGTSIETFLSNYCGRKDVLTPVFPHVGGHFPRNYQEFLNLSELYSSGLSQSLCKRIRRFVSRQKFYNHISASDVRNRVPPEVWDSYFKFCVERNPWDKTLSHYYMIRERLGREMSLEEYFENGDFCSDYEKYTDTCGELLVDRIVKYESLVEELGEVFSFLGIPFEGSLGVRAKSVSRPAGKKEYNDLFTSVQVSEVRNAFSRELELLDYETCNS